MKKVVLTMAVLLMANFAVKEAMAQAPVEIAATEQDEKVKITVEELPAAVKTTLAGDAYAGWTISEVYHNKTKDNYEVAVRKEAESKTLKFSKEGKEVE